MELISLGHSDLRVTPICLGTMTFGEQVNEADSHQILDAALAHGINFIDTAEMYSVPTRAATYGATETIIGNWFAKRPQARERVVLGTKIAGPARGMNWIRGGNNNLRRADFVQALDDSLKRLKTDWIDLYQIHWPNRNAPSFGSIYFDPAKDAEYSSVHEQLEALADLIKAGKVRAIGLSNETPYGVCEFIHVAEQHNLPRIATVQNPYFLSNRAVDNGLDEALHRHRISLLAYSPLSFGLLTGKYDASGLEGNGVPIGRLALYESMRRQRWGRPLSVEAAKRYNALARRHGMRPVQMALAFCYTSWRVASTIIGVTTREQLAENVAVWGTTLSTDVLREIDAIRWEFRDPAQ